MKLLEGNEYRIDTVVTSWKPMDIAIGVSDISIYEFTKQYNIKLLINNNIHLKSIVSYDFNVCTVSSSNITNKGLGLSNKYNWELGTKVENLSCHEKAYFDSIIDSSELVTELYYKNIKKQVDVLSKNIEDIPNGFNIPVSTREEFLTSELPYFNKPNELFKVLTDPEIYSDDEIRSAYHDIRLYKLEESSSEKDMYLNLKKEFKKNIFINEFLEYNGNGKFFGELTNWLHNKLKDVPSPRRYEVKEYQQRVYNYIEYLLGDEYKIEVPKKYSQKLIKIG